MTSTNTTQKPTRGIGRPTTYTTAVVDRICERIVSGESLSAMTREPGMPGLSTVMQWLGRHPDFAERYARAKADQADTLADEIMEIADALPPMTADGRFDAAAVAHARLRIEARKWIASKLKPKKYGERISQEITGADGGAIQISDADRAARVAQLMALASQRQALGGDDEGG